jgi:hypothetical protein
MGKELIQPTAVALQFEWRHSLEAYSPGIGLHAKNGRDSRHETHKTTFGLLANR